MSLSQTYGRTVAVALDMFGSAVLFNRDDVTISSLCGLYRRMVSGDKAARNLILLGLALHGWQIELLRLIGGVLERFWPGHCEAAIQADFARAQRTLVLLQ